MAGDSQCIGRAHLEVTIGPTYKACMDILKLGCELFELIPDWHKAERRELELRLTALADQIEAGLRIGR